MGKPFHKEIEEISSTIKWALNEPTDKLYERIFGDISKPLIIVGSGGSFSACLFVASIYQNMGNIAKAVTPLELYYSRNTLKNAKVLFISSSGRNNDILFSFKLALKYASEVTSVCMRINAPLTKLANSIIISKGFEYDIPSKKDGFLATNSLTAFFILFAKSCNNYISRVANDFQVTDSFRNDVSNFVRLIDSDSTLMVLYGGWSKAIAFDIESKFTEAALGNVLLTDYRNFGHGRHHWFAKRGNNSAIVSIISGEDNLLADKTLNLIPRTIPILKIESKSAGELSSIELLIKSFQLVDCVGNKFQIDPGRPGVPEFGKKLYHLKYATFYKNESIEKDGSIEENAILRKIGKSAISQLSSEELLFWKNHYSNFVRRLSTTKFSSIVFDYDGTLCSHQDRYCEYMQKDMVAGLLKLLASGIVIGIATGRGDSVKKVLTNSQIPKKYWNQIILGYYNGSEIGTLNDSSIPSKNKPINDALIAVEQDIKKNKYILSNIEIKLKPSQLTIENSNSPNWNLIKKYVQNIVMSFYNEGLLLLESSHSLDIVVKAKASKLNVVKKCIEISSNNNCLTIGDKGHWPGNDHELLSTPYSLSVDEVSTIPDRCWNILELGLTSTMATLSYLEKIKLSKNFFSISI